MARLSVASVAMTVTSITAVSERGIRRNVRGEIERQSTVSTDTTTITATSAAIGIAPTAELSRRTRMSRKTPEKSVVKRVRPDDSFTPTIV